MNAFAAAVLACRLLALYVLSQSLSALPSLPLVVSAALQADQFRGFSDIAPPDVSTRLPNLSQPILLSVLLPVLVSIAFSVFLWFKSGWLAARMAPADAPTTEAAPLGKNLQPILLTAIGVLMLVTAIPEMARAVASALLTPSEIVQSPGWMAVAVAERWALLFRFLLGCGLTFGAAPLSRALDRLKSD